MVETKELKHPYLWFQPVFNSSACNCCGGAVCIIGKTHEAPQQVFRLLVYSLSYIMGATGFMLSKVLAARKKPFPNARARKNKYTARMLAKNIIYPYFVHHNRSEWMKGISLVWSKDRHFSSSLPRDRHLKRSGAKSRGTALNF